MICLTVTPTSRRLARVDLLNAAARADVVELCLDHLAKEPDFNEMLEGVSKPVVVSCRRPREGGHFKGTEEQRLALLRQAIVAGPAYVELEPDTAKVIPPFGATQRIVAHTADEPEKDVDALVESLVKDCRADLVKLAWRTDDLEQAWALLAAIAGERAKPVVGMGIGRASRTVQILGMRYGAHWVYAALEPEMAVHAGDATLFELEEVYDTAAITGGTRFLGLIGFPLDVESKTVRVFNAGLGHYELPYRCLPIHLRRTDKARDMFEKLKLSALVVHPESGVLALGIAERRDEAARRGQCADLVLKTKQGWTASNALGEIAAEAIAAVLPESSRGTTGLEKRSVLIVGAGGLAQTIAHGLGKAGGAIGVAAPDDAESQQLARACGGRHVPYASLYDTLADVVVFADPGLHLGPKRSELNPGFLRSSMTVLDVCRIPEEGALVREARSRGCRVIDPVAVFARLLARQFQTIVGKPLPDEALAPLR